MTYFVNQTQPYNSKVYPPEKYIERTTGAAQPHPFKVLKADPWYWAIDPSMKPSVIAGNTGMATTKKPKDGAVDTTVYDPDLVGLYYGSPCETEFVTWQDQPLRAACRSAYELAWKECHAYNSTIDGTTACMQRRWVRFVSALDDSLARSAGLPKKKAPPINVAAMTKLVQASSSKQVRSEGSSPTSGLVVAAGVAALAGIGILAWKRMSK